MGEEWSRHLHFLCFCFDDTGRTPGAGDLITPTPGYAGFGFRTGYVTVCCNAGLSSAGRSTTDATVARAVWSSSSKNTALHLHMEGWSHVTSHICICRPEKRFLNLMHLATSQHWPIASSLHSSSLTRMAWQLRCLQSTAPGMNTVA